MILPPHEVDTNVLLRSVDPSDAQHLLAVKAIQRLKLQGTRLCILPQNVRDFWNACTRPLARNGLGLTPTQADVAVIDLESSFEILEESLATYQKWRRLVVLHQVSGVQVHDANLAAAMNVHGITHLLTFNGRDFARYTNITTVDPMTV